ncbi:hypothetical protein E8E11_007774 [Didymella keratinophila]|nr:hypothetical protein E8E11_007774 [Didymella keratinophila]
MATDDIDIAAVQRTNAITTGNDNTVTDLHSQCSRSLSIKTRRIGRSNHPLPTLNLQLPLFFAAYNDIARTGYVITEDLHIDLIRPM